MEETAFSLMGESLFTLLTSKNVLQWFECLGGEHVLSRGGFSDKIDVEIITASIVTQPYV